MASSCLKVEGGVLWICDSGTSSSLYILSSKRCYSTQSSQKNSKCEAVLSSTPLQFSMNFFFPRVQRPNSKRTMTMWPCAGAGADYSLTNHHISESTPKSSFPTQKFFQVFKNGTTAIGKREYEEGGREGGGS